MWYIPTDWNVRREHHINLKGSFIGAGQIKTHWPINETYRIVDGERNYTIHSEVNSFDLLTLVRRRQFAMQIYRVIT